MNNEKDPYIDLVQQAIDDVTAPLVPDYVVPDYSECSAVSYNPPRPIVQTIAHLQQYADGTLADILATLRRMAEKTVQQLQDEKDACSRWLEKAEEQLQRILPQREALVLDRERSREDYEHACQTIVRMHEAATGVTGAGPRRGVVEDVQDLRDECTRLLDERTAILLRLGVEGTSQPFVLDHIDYLKRESAGYAGLQDIADCYRAALSKIADAIEHNNWPQALMNDPQKFEWVKTTAKSAVSPEATQ